jgi:iron complex outermembrane receptor protein
MAAAFAAAVCVGPVIAADKASAANETGAADNTLAEIVVTAQFRAQKLQDTPLAITAVNAAMMEERGQTSLHDIGQQAPNVTLVETGGAFGPGMTSSIRGIGQGDFDPAFAPGVGIYIDDVYYTSLTGSNFSLLDLDRVEILRGPQGTLSGANSEGGSIKLYSVKPQGNDSGYVKVSYGERNLLDIQAMGDFALFRRRGSPPSAGTAPAVLRGTRAVRITTAPDWRFAGLSARPSRRIWPRTSLWIIRKCRRSRC